MALSDLIDEKSRFLMALQAAKESNAPPDDVRRMANHVAKLESKIAEQLLEANDHEKATVNLVSQASCLVDAGRMADAVEVYREALEHLDRPHFQEWVNAQINGIYASNNDRPPAVSSENEYRFVERPFLDLLEAQGEPDGCLGWQVIDQGIGIPQRPEDSLRASFREVVLKGVFCESVRKINLNEDGSTWLTDFQLESLYDELTTISVPSLVEANQTIHKMLIRHQVDENETTGETDPDVTLIDFEHPERNHFVAINQFRINTPSDWGRKFIIPDIVLFVNGMPLVVIECKDANSFTSNPMYEAFKQLLRYSNQREETKLAGLKEGEPRLFHFNQFMVRTCGEKADYGSVTATDEDFYFPWRDIDNERRQEFESPLGKQRAQETLIQGMLAPETLLDILRTSTVFMDTESGQRVKVVCRYQQYRATQKIIRRLRDGQTGGERSGVIWHTQGSGKSLTMVFVIRKLRRCDDLKDFKVALINDRRDLEKQLGATAALTGESVTFIRSTKELREKMANDQSNLNMIMLHKFLERAGKHIPDYIVEAIKLPKFEDFGEVNPSDRILLMIDEAHRTQSSDLGDNLFEAFPKATRLAFTGTPLITDRHKKKTTERFGDYIDKYKLDDARKDGATVQILYEGKTADTALAEKHEFDTKFEDLFADRTPEELLAIRKKYGATGDILEAEKRIEAIANDLTDHYIDNILPNGFKAQVVCHSKLACAHYEKYINAAIKARLEKEQSKPVYEGELTDLADGERSKFRDDEVCKQIAFLKSAVVVSSDETNEKAVVTEARKRGKAMNAVVNFKKKFKYDDPESENTGIAFLIVCDMLLTGFDAPIEQVMYLDRKITEHDLLQTIARVNRVHKGKSRGYVVDYIGLANHLKEALSIYAGEDYDDAKNSLKKIASEIPVLEGRYQRLLQLFKDNNGLADIQGFVEQTIPDEQTNFDIREQAVVLLEDIKIRADFEVYLRNFMQSMDIILPNSQAHRFRIPCKRFGYLLAQAKQRYKDDSLNISGAGEKVKRLINEHLISLGIDPKIPPIELLSPDFIDEVDKHTNPKAKASEMEHAIRKHCKVHFEEDPAFYARLSEKLDAVIQQHKDNWDNMCEALGGLRSEAQEGRTEVVDGVTRQAAPFYDLTVQIAFGDSGVPQQHDAAVKKLIQDAIEELQQTIDIINFWDNPFEVSKLRGKLSDLCMYTGIDEIVENSDQIVTEIAALAKTREKDILK